MIKVTTSHDEASAVGHVRFADGERNYLSPELLAAISEAYADLEDAGARAVVLSTPSKHFCAGANFSGDDPGRSRAEREFPPIYEEVPGLFDRRIPVVAVVDGAAIGGGLGLAMSADFRIAGPAARFAANFAQIGLSPGFGLSHTLPAAIGRREAARLLYTGRRIGPDEAGRINLCDSVAESREAAEADALAFAREIATSAPGAIHAIHTLLNPDTPTAVRAALEDEFAHQRVLYGTEDFREGVSAGRERRSPRFRGA